MSEKQHIRFIINPISGIGKQKKLEQLLPHHLDCDKFSFDIAYTQHAGHAYDLAKEAVNASIPIIAIVGGDGSINEAGRALMHSESTLAIIPTGSGNGIARHHKIPLATRKAIALINSGSSKKTDVGLLNEIPFFGFAGMGFDAHIAHEFAALGQRGLQGYAKVVLREWSKYKAQTCTLSNGSEEIKLEPFLITVANVSQYGNGVIIDAKANAMDGQLAVCALERVKLHSFPSLFLRSLGGRLDRSGKFTRMEGSAFQIRNHRFNRIHIDGDPLVISDSDINIRVLSRSLRILLP